MHRKLKPFITVACCLVILINNVKASDILGDIVTDNFNQTICNCTRVVMEAISDYQKDNPPTATTTLMTPAAQAAIAGATFAGLTLLFTPETREKIVRVICYPIYRIISSVPSYSDPTLGNIAEIFSEDEDPRLHGAFRDLHIALSTEEWRKTPINDDTSFLIGPFVPLKYLIGYSYSHLNTGGGRTNIHLVGSGERKKKHLLHKDQHSFSNPLREITDQFVGEGASVITQHMSVGEIAARLTGLTATFFNNEPYTRISSIVKDILQLTATTADRTVDAFANSLDRFSVTFLSNRAGGLFSYSLYVRHVPSNGWNV